MRCVSLQKWGNLAQMAASVIRTPICGRKHKAVNKSSPEKQDTGALSSGVEERKAYKKIQRCKKHYSKINKRKKLKVSQLNIVKSVIPS